MELLPRQEREKVGGDASRDVARDRGADRRRGHDWSDGASSFSPSGSVRASDPTGKETGVVTHVMRANDPIGLPVVSITSGEDVAEVRDVVYDAHGHRLVGFTVNKRGMLSGRLKEVLLADSLAAVRRTR